MPASIIWNRKPLPRKPFAPLPLTAIRPRGWLRERVEMQTPHSVYDRLVQAGVLRDIQAMQALESDLLQAVEGEEALSKDQLRALMALHGATADKRIAIALLKRAKALYERDGAEAIAAEQAADGSDWTHAALWLYNLTGQRWLLTLCKQLKGLAPDWTSTFHVFSQTRAVTDAPDRAQDAYWRVHGPTIASALKAPALQALFEGGAKNEQGFAAGWERLTRHHGVAGGLYTAGPLLAGGNPSAPIDEGIAPELLHTLGVLLWAQDGVMAADLREALAYGPLLLPQDAQSANTLHAGNARACGLCHLVAGLWMASADEGLAATGYAPSEMRWRIQDQLVRIITETNYPYQTDVRLTVRLAEPLQFPLRLRIPTWAEGACVRVGDQEAAACTAGEYACIDRLWQDGDVITLALPMPVRQTRRYHQSVSVERGPLVYALPVNKDAPWNVALLPDASFEESFDGGIPILRTQAAVVPAWKQSGDAPAAPPVSPVVQREALCQIALYPLGEVGAHIAQFPVGRLME